MIRALADDRAPSASPSPAPANQTPGSPPATQSKSPRPTRQTPCRCTAHCGSERCANPIHPCGRGKGAQFQAQTPHAQQSFLGHRQNQIGIRQGKHRRRAEVHPPCSAHHTALAEQGVEGDQKIHVQELHAEHSWLIWIDSDAALAANPRCRRKLARDER